MIAPIAIIVLSKRPRVVLKPSHDRVSAMFNAGLREKSKSVWVDGHDTGVRVPNEDPGFFAVMERTNKRGDLGGEFSYVYGGAMDGTNHYPFLKRSGRPFVLLPPCGNNAEVVRLDKRGRLLAVDDPPMTNLTEVCHAHLWTGIEWINLGPADRAHVEIDGSIVGSFASSRAGRPLEPIDYGGEGFRVRFRWKEGKRTESKPYQA